MVKTDSGRGKLHEQDAAGEMAWKPFFSNPSRDRARQKADWESHILAQSKGKSSQSKTFPDIHNL